jgi:hypothetical protein
MNKKPSFEERLTSVSSPEKVKSAKLLLKNDRLLGAWRDAEGRVNAVFSDRGKLFATNVRTGEAPHCQCDCGTAGGALCEHSVAALMYSGRFNLRIPRSLHERLAYEAKQEGVSLNQYALYKLAR